ncbi:hypothetical protein FRC01_013867, partial [Tulasnella sp. 417]
TAPPRLGNDSNRSPPPPRSRPSAPYAEPNGDQPECRDLDLSDQEDLDGRALGRLSNTAADGDWEWADPHREDWELDGDEDEDEDEERGEGEGEDEDEDGDGGEDGGEDEDEDEDRGDDASEGEDDGDGESEAEGENQDLDEDEDEDEGEEEGRRKGQKGGKQRRSAAGHPEYAPFLMRTDRRARSIIITRSPMPTPEQEYQPVCDAWEYVTQGSRFEGKPFPEKLYSIVQQHNPTIRGRLKTVAVSLLGDYFKFSDPNLARNRQLNQRLYHVAVDDDSFLYE